MNPLHGPQDRNFKSARQGFAHMSKKPIESRNPSTPRCFAQDDKAPQLFFENLEHELFEHFEARSTTPDALDIAV